MSMSAPARYSVVMKPSLNFAAALMRSTSAAGIGSPVFTWRAKRLNTSGVEHPVLEQLARELDEIARHARAGQRRIGHVGAQTMHRVTELVEQRRRIVPGDEHRRPGRALDEVGVVGHDRQHLSVELLLIAIIVHPGAGLLAGARVRIEVPQAHRADPSTCASPCTPSCPAGTRARRSTGVNARSNSSPATQNMPSRSLSSCRYWRTSSASRLYRAVRTFSA